MGGGGGRGGGRTTCCDLLTNPTKPDQPQRSIDKVIGEDARSRVVVEYIGSPLTHRRFLNRFKGTYGASPSGLLKNGNTPVEGLVLCGDSVFPGIGVPSVALSGAAAANGLVTWWKQLQSY